MTELRDVWEETSFILETKQANPECVLSEKEGLKKRKHPNWKLSFDLKEVNLREIGLKLLKIYYLQFMFQ